MNINDAILQSKPALTRFAKKLTARSSVEWEDLVNDTVLRLLTYIKYEYRGETKFRNLCFTICETIFYDGIRKIKKNKQLVFDIKTSTCYKSIPAPQERMIYATEMINHLCLDINTLGI